jgi:hypothetical protein
MHPASENRSKLHYPDYRLRQSKRRPRKSDPKQEATRAQPAFVAITPLFSGPKPAWQAQQAQKALLAAKSKAQPSHRSRKMVWKWDALGSIMI